MRFEDHIYILGEGEPITNVIGSLVRHAQILVGSCESAQTRRDCCDLDSR